MNTAIISESKEYKDLNALTLYYNSVGQPEEIEFDVRIEPVK